MFIPAPAWPRLTYGVQTFVKGNCNKVCFHLLSFTGFQRVLRRGNNDAPKNIGLHSGIHFFFLLYSHIAAWNCISKKEKNETDTHSKKGNIWTLYWSTYSTAGGTDEHTGQYRVCTSGAACGDEGWTRVGHYQQTRREMLQWHLNNASKKKKRIEYKVGSTVVCDV